MEVPVADLPVFAIVVPTYKDADGLKRTLVNIINQPREFAMIRRNVYVMGDGFERRAKKAIEFAAGVAQRAQQNVSFWYHVTKEHHGTGNIPRDAGLQVAEGTWVCFIDAGTSVCNSFLPQLVDAHITYPEAKVVTWDMVQMLDPIPIVTSVYAVQQMPRTHGLPYVFPGCATMWRLPDAQQVRWPNVRESDWAYSCLMWEKLFVVGGVEDTEKVDREVVLVPKVLTVAYGARTLRRQRNQMTGDEYNKMKYDKGWGYKEEEVSGEEEEVQAG